MKKIKSLVACLLLAVTMVAPLYTVGSVQAASIAGETFTGVSTPSNTWISGGGSELACLTAASSSAANSIPACTGGAIDSPGSGVLRLTSATNSQSGFAIYNTPVSASEGLNIEFDMYQYAGTGADGIVFFLIDGTASPTQPGALGGSLGYAGTNGAPTPGLVGGYVGVGFDRYGNFSAPGFGGGGPGRAQNSITVRGSQATSYQYVTKKTAAGALAVEAASTRASAKRHVRVSVSTNNIMTVAVNYFDGAGLRTELSGINLNTINGAGTLPSTFKFGFSAGTGGSNNVHEVGGMTVDPLKSNVGVVATHSASFRQGETGTVTLTATNDSGAQNTNGLITVTDTLPAGLTATTASGTGWNCTVVGQVVTCTRPGSGGSALAPGASAPAITIPVAISTTAGASLSNTGTISVPEDINPSPTFSDTIAVAAMGDSDGIIDSVEAAAPNSGDANNDGIQDKLQVKVSSLPNPVSGNYAVLENSGCSSNSNVSVFAESANASADGDYAYPAGLMDFQLACAAPGDTATITQYYYGTYDSSKLVLRKYNATTHVYRDVPGAVLSTVTIGGLPALKIVYQVTDGSSLDDDGLANGVIVDPAGPALSTAVITAPAATVVAAPDTGLLPESATAYYLACAAGLALLAAELTLHRRKFNFAKAGTPRSI